MTGCFRVWMPDCLFPALLLGATLNLLFQISSCFNPFYMTWCLPNLFFHFSSIHVKLLSQPLLPVVFPLQLDFFPTISSSSVPSTCRSFFNHLFQLCSFHRSILFQPFLPQLGALLTSSSIAVPSTGRSFFHLFLPVLFLQQLGALPTLSFRFVFRHHFPPLHSQVGPVSPLLCFCS